MALDAWPVGLPNYDTRGYSLELQDTLLRTQMDSGLTRVRRSSTFTPTMLTCRWVLDAAQLRIFRNFYHSNLADGTEPFTLPVYAGSAGENKATNADMEVAPGGGSSFLNWIEAGTNTRLTLVSDEKHSGGYAVKIDRSAAATSFLRMWQTVGALTGDNVVANGLDISQGALIHVSCWMKAAGTAVGKNGQILAYEVTNGGSPASNSTVNINPVMTGDWQYLSGSGTIEEAGRTDLQLYVGGNTGSHVDGDIYYVDDVFIGNAPENGFYDQQARFAEPYRISYRTADTWAVAARLEVLDDILNV